MTMWVSLFRRVRAHRFLRGVWRDGRRHLWYLREQTAVRAVWITDHPDTP